MLNTRNEESNTVEQGPDELARSRFREGHEGGVDVDLWYSAEKKGHKKWFSG